MRFEYRTSAPALLGLTLAGKGGVRLPYLAPNESRFVAAGATEAAKAL